ncbi:Murein DD-endopeptidase MepM and murein hydrolase activator NlpD, contain LysM domain [Streptomyces sp. WMMB 714]|nr:M23 family metallopeptidase [Streptomyces sp. WMMB 714]SCK15904.1 Murein DD-endopeptidase MepM and murein hydrolase activator NlpD, contain LysM domain [Streptomyces sp. WMMB 714]
MKLVVNDRHPSGSSLPADTSSDFSYGAHDGYYEQAVFDIHAQQHGTSQGHPGAYDGYSAVAQGDSAAAFGDGDPLFGSMPGTGTDAANAGYATGSHDVAYAGQGSGAYDVGGYDNGAAWGQYGQSSGQWDATQWNAGTGQWDATQWEGQWNSQAEAGSWETGRQEAQPAEHAGQYAEAAYDGYAYGYDASVQGLAHQDQHDSYDSLDPEAAAAFGTYEQQPSQGEFLATDGEPDATAAFPAFDSFHSVDAVPDAPAGQVYDDGQVYDEGHGTGWDHGAAGPDGREHPGTGPDFTPGTSAAPEATTIGPPPHLRSRRRAPRPRRSAMLTVAVPSVAVMGVAGIAAASVAGNSPDDSTTTQASAPDSAVQPANSKLDTQLAGLSADADDFADRASRTQERIDLKERQEAERERKAREAARKEALRPKFALPVKEHGLSAQYGQAGLNWMSVHTGIDFPVSEGTPVMAATDGTVTTKYDVSFGNMAVVTAPDGTETWYCHLSSTKIRSGEVKAGDTIGYSGSSGNSTGPHLHFEVHPGGGEAIDPLPWLRSKGLDPS